MASPGDATEEILRRLANIERQVASIDETNAFAMRASRDALQVELQRVFGTGMKRAQVYLAANGRRSTTEIADLLDMLPNNVSRELTHLTEEGLTVPTGEPVRYRKKRSVDQALGVSTYLKQKFDLNTDGTPA